VSEQVTLLFVTRHLGFYGGDSKVAAKDRTSDGKDTMLTNLWSCGKQELGRTTEVTDECGRNK